MTSRRGFLTGLGTLAAMGAAGWVLRDKLLRPTLQFATDAPASGRLPFLARHTELPVVPVSLAGRTVPALIDSGAEHTVVDAAFAQDLALPAAWTPPAVAFGVGGGAQVGRGVAFDLTVGALQLTQLKAVALSLGPIASPKSLGAPLVLGQDLLGGLVAEIDFGARWAALHRPQGYQPPADVEAAPARSRLRGLQASLTVEGQRVEALFDTGSSAPLSLSRASAERLGLLDVAPVRSDETVVFGGVTRSEVVRAESLTFAGRTLKDVEVSVFDTSGVPGFPEGLVGVGAVRHRRIILDLGTGRLLLGPSVRRQAV